MWTTLKTCLCFKFKEFVPFTTSSSGKICGMKLGSAESLFVSPSPESFSLGYPAPGISSFSVWLCSSRLLSIYSLNCKKTLSTKSPFGSDFILFMFTTSWTSSSSSSCSLFWYTGGKRDNNSFSSLNG